MSQFELLRNVTIGQYIPTNSVVHRLDPRTKLVIVGSSHVLQARPEDPALAGWVRLFEDLLRSCSRYTVTYGEGS